MCTARGLEPLPRLLQPRRAVAVRAPQAAAFPAGVRIVDASVETLGVEAHRVRNAQHDHLAVLQRHEAVIEIGGRDRDVLAKSDRVVLVDPGVVARLGASVFEAFEARSGILVERPSPPGNDCRLRVGPLSGPLHLRRSKLIKVAARARAPEHAVLVDVAAADADAWLRHCKELDSCVFGSKRRKPAWPPNMPNVYQIEPSVGFGITA